MNHIEMSHICADCTKAGDCDTARKDGVCRLIWKDLSTPPTSTDM
jgi:hypothetical protein